MIRRWPIRLSGAIHGALILYCIHYKLLFLFCALAVLYGVELIILKDVRNLENKIKSNEI